MEYELGTVFVTRADAQTVIPFVIIGDTSERPKKIPWDADSPFCFSDLLLFFTGFATKRSKKYIKTYKNAAAAAATAATAAAIAAAAAAATAAAAAK